LRKTKLGFYCLAETLLFGAKIAVYSLFFYSAYYLVLRKHWNGYFCSKYFTMIQRIQTVYILLAGILAATLFKLKLADLSVNGELMQFFAKGIFKGEEVVFDGLPILLFVGLITLLHLAVIFLFKKRVLQIRMLVFTIILLLGLFGMFFYFTYAGFEGAKVAFKIPVAFPLIAVILDWLAVRAIGKDEALIRSLNRIR
jgi:hypothetical protein